MRTAKPNPLEGILVHKNIVHVLLGLGVWLCVGCTLGLDFERDVEPPEDTTPQYGPLDVASDNQSLEVDEELFVPDRDDALDGIDGEGGPVAPVCGNGVVEPGEGCDDGGLDANGGCLPGCVVRDGWGCVGSSPSRCSLVSDLTLTSDFNLSESATGGRVMPDAIAYRVLEVEGTFLTLDVVGAVKGLSRGDELLLVQLFGGDANAPNHEFLVVEGVNGRRVEVQRPRNAALKPEAPNDLFIVQRVPRFRNVNIGPHVLSSGPMKGLWDRSPEGAPAILTTGIVAFRATGTVALDGGSIQARGGGYPGGAPARGGALYVETAMTLGRFSGEDGAGPAGISSGGDGGGEESEARGGDGGMGLSESGCPAGPGGVGRSAGGGAGASCFASGCARPPCWTGSAGGGGESAQLFDPAIANVTSDDFSRLGPGAGASQGGGGGGPAGPGFVLLDGCSAAKGGDLNGRGGAGGNCSGVAGESGTEGESGGGIIWLRAEALLLQGGATLDASGGRGGVGGRGGESVDDSSPGGGGGAGGMGGTGGTIRIDARTLTIDLSGEVEYPALLALSGAGGDGGAGGGVDNGAGGRSGGVGGLGAAAGSNGAEGANGTAGGLGGGGGGRGGQSGFAGRILLAVDTFQGVTLSQPSDVGALVNPRPFRVQPFAP